MTDQPTPAVNAAEDPQEALKQAALADESQAAQEAAMIHLQQRVVALNVEVRVRDARIAELEAQVADLEAKVPDSGEPDA